MILSRKTLSLCLLILLVGCKKSYNKNPENDQSLVYPISKEEVKANLAYLASDALKGRRTGSQGIEKAAVYLENIFKQHNIKPFFETYRSSFDFRGLQGNNIVGYIEGNDDTLKKEFIILGAHYDHIGIASEVNGDFIANGANDNASGTVTVLEIAKYFSKSKSNKRSIIFALFAGEEMGLVGSTKLASRLNYEDLDIYLMLNFEMTGVPRDSKKPFAYITGYEYSNIASKMNKYSKHKIFGSLQKSKELNLFQRSDNYPFYLEFNVPAHTISTFDFTNFDYYDHVDDEINKIDFEHLTKFIGKMIPPVEAMSNSTSRDIKLNDASNE